MFVLSINHAVSLCMGLFETLHDLAIIDKNLFNAK